jgi:hypothetical protein
VRKSNAVAKPLASTLIIETVKAQIPYLQFKLFGGRNVNMMR